MHGKDLGIVTKTLQFSVDVSNFDTRKLNLWWDPMVPHKLCLKTSLIIYFVGVLMLQHKPEPKLKLTDVG